MQVDKAQEGSLDVEHTNATDPAPSRARLPTPPCVLPVLPFTHSILSPPFFHPCAGHTCSGGFPGDLWRQQEGSDLPISAWTLYGCKMLVRVFVTPSCQPNAHPASTGPGQNWATSLPTPLKIHAFHRNAMKPLFVSLGIIFECFCSNASETFRFS